MSTPILHEYSPSGNCYKIRLTAAHLGIPIERREYDILKGETRTPAFLRDVNGNGRIPVLQLGDRFLPESNAACFYLAEGSALIPQDAFERADMLRWMFFEQYNHEPNIATLCFWLAYVCADRLTDLQKALIPGKIEAGNAAMALLDEQLGRTRFLAGDAFTLADICLFAYSHVAEAGGFDLATWPHVQRWIGEIEAMPGHIAIDA